MLTWRLELGRLTIEWTETGGPSVEAPARQGYGSKVISSAVKRQLGGQVQTEWRPEGLRCTLRIPASDEMAQSNEVVIEPEDARASVAVKWALLVEDEALVAMMMRDMLVELGFGVLGPFAHPGDALKALGSHPVDVAVLDVNLGGQLVYPVADALVQGGVPFVFVTGYAAESIDGRFAAIPVLQKPIERDKLAWLVSHGSSLNSTARTPLAPRGAAHPRAGQTT